MIIFIISVAFKQIVIVATIIAVMLKRKNAYSQTTLEKLKKVIVKFKNKTLKTTLMRLLYC